MAQRTMDYKDAESAAMKWIRKKYRQVKRVDFRKVWKEQDLWTVDGKVEFKTGIFSTDVRDFKVQVSAETGEIIGYSD